MVRNRDEGIVRLREIAGDTDGLEKQISFLFKMADECRKRQVQLDHEAAEIEDEYGLNLWEVKK